MHSRWVHLDKIVCMELEFNPRFPHFTSPPTSPYALSSTDLTNSTFLQKVIMAYVLAKMSLRAETSSDLLPSYSKLWHLPVTWEAFKNYLLKEC